jgi:hypothetical protein
MNENNNNDDLRAAKGIIVGFLIGMLYWFIIFSLLFL